MSAFQCKAPFVLHFRSCLYSSANHDYLFITILRTLQVDSVESTFFGKHPEDDGAGKLYT